jgi:hypothetical protein
MSTGLVYLRSENFGVDKIKEGPVLCNSIKGFSVVLFYSPQHCQYSPGALQEFKRIVGTVNGVVFAVLNIDSSMDVVRRSRNTITPIEGVPYIMLYYNGIPRQVYPDSYDLTAEAIRNFSASVSTRIAHTLSPRVTGGNNSTTSRTLQSSQEVTQGIYFIHDTTKTKRKKYTYINL